MKTVEVATPVFTTVEACDKPPPKETSVGTLVPMLAPLAKLEKKGKPPLRIRKAKPRSKEAAFVFSKPWITADFSRIRPG